MAADMKTLPQSYWKVFYEINVLKLSVMVQARKLLLLAPPGRKNVNYGGWMFRGAHLCAF